jgi:exodeoxyribonuclease V alpha subunit
MVTVRGLVRTVTFQNDDQSFSVVRFLTVDGQELTVVGPLGPVNAGEPVRVTGTWEEHGTHGKQLRAQAVVPELPATPDGIRRLLGSGFVPDIGATLAGRIVDRFGTSTLDVIADHPQRLKEVPGIGKARAERIQEAFRARRAEVESKAFMQALGVGPALARKVWERFGADTTQVLRDNPYRLAEEIAGIGFLTADRVGRAVGIRDEDPRRIAACALYLLLQAVDDGHTGAPPEELAVNAHEFGVARAQLLEALDRLTDGGMVVRDRDLIYPPPLHRAEVSVARLAASQVLRPVRPMDPRTLGAPEVARALETLSATQREAVRATLDHGLLVLTGGPGTGKTTTVRAVVALHKAAGHKIALAAPTGRAAKRLSEATSHSASTLHRLLEWDPRLQRFLRDEDHTLDADLVLVDEASMVDVQLAQAVLEALPPGARVVFVGDADQLPPVGPGTVLSDLLALPEVHAVRLREVFRQAAQSAIVRAAYDVLRGTVPRPSPARRPLEPGAPAVPPAGEFFWLKCDDAERAAALLVQTVAERLPRAFGLDPLRDVQVLVPTHRGPLGAQALNLALQGALNPGVARGRRGFSPGDKVMQHKNNYDLDVWNGDVGVVVAVDDKTVKVRMDNREVVFTGPQADALYLAFASTTHKAQGSEYDAVVLGLHTSHYMLLNRSLLYTAITRARRLVVLVGSERAVRLAVDTERVGERHGALRERLRERLQAAARRAETA